MLVAIHLDKAHSLMWLPSSKYIQAITLEFPSIHFFSPLCGQIYVRYFNLSTNFNLKFVFNLKAKRDIFDPLAYSPNACSSWSMAKWGTGIPSPIRMGGVQTLEPSFAAFLSMWTRTWIGNEPGMTWTGVNMGCWWHNQCPNPVSHNSPIWIICQVQFSDIKCVHFGVTITTRQPFQSLVPFPKLICAAE